MGSRETEPQKLCGATAPTQFSHPLTTTFHLHDRTMSRPMCNAKARGQNYRPTWEKPDGTPRETQPVCESPWDLCGPGSQSRGYTTTRALGLGGWGGSLPMNHGFAEPSLGLPGNSLKVFTGD